MKRSNRSPSGWPTNWFKMNEEQTERITKRTKTLALIGAGVYLVSGIIADQLGGYSFIAPLMMAAFLGGALAMKKDSRGLDESVMLGMLYGMVGAVLYHYYQETYPFFAILVFGGMLGLSLERGISCKTTKITCAMAGSAAGLFAFVVSGSLVSSSLMLEYLPYPVVQAAAGAGFGFSISLAELLVIATSNGKEPAAEAPSDIGASAPDKPVESVDNVASG